LERAFFTAAASLGPLDAGGNLIAFRSFEAFQEGSCIILIRRAVECSLEI